MPLFKAYDVRGIVPDELNDDIAYRIGRAAVEFLGAKRLLVGRDMRESSGPLSKALCDGITDAGADVVWIGQCVSPMVYFGVGKFRYEGGIMVTASHNPAEYNGMKFCREDAIPIGSNSGLQDIEKRAEALAQSTQVGSIERKGKLIEKGILDDYIAHVLHFARDIKPMRLVIDTGNGMAGKVLTALIPKLPIQVKRLYFEPDGSFPNHEADPLKDENIMDLQKAVLAEKADLGIAFDGDGDRVAFVDENAKRVPSDLISALIAQEILTQTKAPVVYDLRSSWVAREEILKYGGTPVESRVGHSFIKSVMRKHNAVFGGEVSGHYYFKDNWFADNADIAWLKVLNVLSRENKPFSEVVRPLRRYYATGEINFHVEDKEAMLEKLREIYKGGEISEMDGVTVRFQEWWFNVRPSNTEPVLRLNLEAKTEDRMRKEKARLEGVLTA
jgi:phosphomannomutase